MYCVRGSIQRRGLLSVRDRYKLENKRTRLRSYDGSGALYNPVFMMYVKDDRSKYLSISGPSRGFICRMRGMPIRPDDILFLIFIGELLA